MPWHCLMLALANILDNISNRDYRLYSQFKNSFSPLEVNATVSPLLKEPNGWKANHLPATKFLPWQINVSRGQRPLQWFLSSRYIQLQSLSSVSISAFYIFCEKSSEIVCVRPQNITLTPLTWPRLKTQLCHHFINTVKLWRFLSNHPQLIGSQHSGLIWSLRSQCPFRCCYSLYGLLYLQHCAADRCVHNSVCECQREKSPNWGWAEGATVLNKTVMMGLLPLPDTASLTRCSFVYYRWHRSHIICGLCTSPDLTI